MIIAHGKIENELRTGFSLKYKRFSSFIDSGILWDNVVTTVNNPRLMENIKFCNDVMKIPPVKPFLLANKLESYPMNKEDNQAVGAIFGFIFKDIFGYKNQESMSCRINTIKTASRFFDEPIDSKIEFEEV